MLIYLSCIQIFIIAFVYLLPLTNLAAAVSATILWAFFLAAGYVLHLKDLPYYYKWLQYISPTSWLTPFLLNRELSPEAVQRSSATTLCRNKQVIFTHIVTFHTVIQIRKIQRTNHKDYLIETRLKAVKLFSFNGF